MLIWYQCNVAEASRNRISNVLIDGQRASGGEFEHGVFFVILFHTYQKIPFMRNWVAYIPFLPVENSTSRPSSHIWMKKFPHSGLHSNVRMHDFLHSHQACRSELQNASFSLCSITSETQECEHSSILLYIRYTGCNKDNMRITACWREFECAEILACDPAFRNRMKIHRHAPLHPTWRITEFTHSQYISTLEC